MAPTKKKNENHRCRRRSSAGESKNYMHIVHSCCRHINFKLRDPQATNRNRFDGNFQCEKYISSLLHICIVVCSFKRPTFSSMLKASCGKQSYSKNVTSHHLNYNIFAFILDTNGKHTMCIIYLHTDCMILYYEGLVTALQPVLQPPSFV